MQVIWRMGMKKPWMMSKLVSCTCAIPYWDHFPDTTQEELLMHEDVMSLVLTFKSVLSQFVEDPDELDLFITLVSDYMHMNIQNWMCGHNLAQLCVKIFTVSHSSLCCLSTTSLPPLRSSCEPVSKQ